MENINIYEDTAGLNYETALALAKEEARSRLEDPMLLAWYEADTGRFSPCVECCGEDEPAWVVYARSRGGRLKVDLNHGRYVFIFR